MLRRFCVEAFPCHHLVKLHYTLKTNKENIVKLNKNKKNKNIEIRILRGC